MSISTIAEVHMPARSLIKRLIGDASGATAVEYGLILVMVSMVIIGALQGLANGRNAVFATVSTGLNSVIPSSSG